MVNSNTTLLEEAVRLHRQGALAEAISRYGEILKGDPANSDALYYLAMAACQQGRFAEGIELAQRILAGDPRQTRTLNLLGMAQGRLGRHADALASFERAIAIAPDFADAHGNRANVLMELGRTEDAVPAYERAVALQPGSIGDWLNLAAALQQLGRYEQAITSCDRALALDANAPEAHYARGNVMAQFGRYPEALASYDAALAHAPRNADTLSNRGHVLMRLGRPEEALTNFDQALAAAPNHAGALVNRGNALKGLGRRREAVVAYEQILAGDPDSVEGLVSCGELLAFEGETGRALVMATRALSVRETPAAKALFVQCVSNRPLTSDLMAVRPILLRAISEPWERPADLAIPALSLIKLDPQIAELCARAERTWPKRLAGLGPGLTAMAGDQLLRAVLETVPICDTELEHVLTAARQNLLDVAAMGAGVAVDEKLLGFFCTLARQCFINEYVFDQTPDEARRVADLCRRLNAALEGAGALSVLWVVAAGAFLPLHTLPVAEKLAQRAWPEQVAGLITQQIREPMAERRLRDAMPSLSPVIEEVSLKAKQQPEENPYPRWVKPSPMGVPKTMAEYFGAWHVGGERNTIDVLVAGCGTGQNLVETARQFKGARVMAIDLSRASLGYAKRQVQALGLDNVTFAEADILGLGDIGERFDIIDASGVLHRLADPRAGWAVLLSLLQPGGFMRVGLYSKLGRTSVNAARALIAERKIPATAEGVRQARQEIIGLPDGAPAKTVARYLDFFTTSECRDALFHVQEHQLTLPEIAAFIGANDVTFVGFIADPRVISRFQARYPDKVATDLDAWHAFETENPAAFAGMYQFWLRKNP